MTEPSPRPRFSRVEDAFGVLAIRSEIVGDRDVFCELRVPSGFPLDIARQILNVVTVVQDALESGGDN
jgi:hypothetical protein